MFEIQILIFPLKFHCFCRMLIATANDISNETFDIKCYPKLFFKTESGNILLYEGDRMKEEPESRKEKL